jgi:hypothetical protein
MRELSPKLARSSVRVSLQACVGGFAQVFSEQIVRVTERFAEHLPVALSRGPACMTLLSNNGSLVCQEKIFLCFALGHVGIMYSNRPGKSFLTLSRLHLQSRFREVLGGKCWVLEALLMRRIHLLIVGSLAKVDAEIGSIRKHRRF